MTSIKEVILGIITTSQERIKNPFISTFIIAWLVSNWEPLFIMLFSKSNIEQRIEVVSHEKFSSSGNLFWIPIACALFYIVILPYLMYTLDYLSSFGREGRKKRNEDEIYRGLVRKEKILVKEFRNEQIRAGKQELEELNSKIIELSQNLDKRDNEVKSNLKIIEDEKRQSSQLRKELREISESMDNMSIQFENIKSSNKDMKNEKDNLEKKLHLSNNELIESSDKIKELNFKVTKLTQELEAKDKDYSSLIRDLTAENDLNISELKNQKQLGEKYREIENELERLKQELNKATNQRNTLNSGNKVLIELVDNLSNKMKKDI